MGEMADYMLNGDDCSGCGVPLLSRPSPGHPRYCRECDEDSELKLIYDATEEEMRANGFITPEAQDAGE